MTLTVHLLPPSPNNTKVLIALAYKEIDFVPKLIDPFDRSELVNSTGQCLTPAMEQDGIKLFDSMAMLRFLDANYPGPRLYASDRESHKEIEKWESFHKFAIGPWLGKAFGMFFKKQDDPEVIAEINQGIHEATEKLESALEGRDWLVGDSMTTADISVACFLSFACYNDEEAEQSPVWMWMQKRFDLGDGREQCRALVHRVLAYLPQFAALTG